MEKDWEDRRWASEEKWRGRLAEMAKRNPEKAERIGAMNEFGLDAKTIWLEIATDDKEVARHISEKEKKYLELALELEKTGKKKTAEAVEKLRWLGESDRTVFRAAKELGEGELEAFVAHRERLFAREKKALPY